MRLILVGAAGDIGRAAHAALAERNEVVTAGRTRGDLRVDMSDERSVAEMYAQAGTVDAVVCCSGDVTFAPLAEFTQESFLHGLKQKVMGQVNLVLGGLGVLTDGGSFTLTSGVLDRDPIREGAAAAAANGALGGFVRGAAIEMPRGLRLNVVSPGVLETSLPRYGDWFPGHRPVSDEAVGRAYVKSVEGALTGQVIIVD